MQEIVHVIPVKSLENIFKFSNIQQLFLIFKKILKKKATSQNYFFKYLKKIFVLTGIVIMLIHQKCFPSVF